MFFFLSLPFFMILMMHFLPQKRCTHAHQTEETIAFDQHNDNLGECDDILKVYT